MATPFKNLEERYNDAVTRTDFPPLYDKANKKFEGGRESTGKSDDQILTRAPGESQKGLKTQTRETFVVSAAQDNERLKRYLTGPKGVKFLLKQQTLQTGNTFASTRIINPLFVLGNTTPYVHTRRHLLPLSVSQIAPALGGLIGGKLGSMISFAGGVANSLGLGKRASNDIAQLRKIAQLQQETYDSKKFNDSGNISKSLWKGLKKVFNQTPLGKTISAVGAKRSMGEVDDGWTKSRPELTHPESEQIIVYKTNINTFFEDLTKNANTPDLKQPFLKYFDGNGIKSQDEGLPYLWNGQGLFSDGVPIDTLIDGVAATSFATKTRADTDPTTGLPKSRKISYIRDVTNKVQLSAESEKEYDSLRSINFDDPINVSFAMGTKGHVQFRAFIKDLRLNLTPEYKTYQYIGRIEKFVNYVGVQREASFKLQVIAFSKEELDGVWTRINYLNGMVFPYGWNKGILQPNIVRLTIGNVFNDQPGYIASMDMNFEELTESWELDAGKQVPMSATINMKFIIIEKVTKHAASPFYSITENMFDASLAKIGPPTPAAGGDGAADGAGEEGGAEFEGAPNPDPTNNPPGNPPPRDIEESNQQRRRIDDTSRIPPRGITGLGRGVGPLSREEIARRRQPLWRDGEPRPLVNP